MRHQSMDKAEAFLTQIEQNIRVLLREYSEGRLNNKQFHILYERYTNQRLIAQQALLTGDDTNLDDHADPDSTLAIRDAHKSKTLGLRVYHTATGAVIETMGRFEVSAFMISPVLAELRQLEREDALNQLRVDNITDDRWLLFNAETLTTLVTLFRNEPSPLQISEIQRRHHDFEVANRPALSSSPPDFSDLAYPFRSFAQRKPGR